MRRLNNKLLWQSERKFLRWEGVDFFHLSLRPGDNTALMHAMQIEGVRCMLAVLTRNNDQSKYSISFKSQ